MKNIINISAIILLLAIVSCKSKKEEEHHEEAAPNEVTITQEQYATIGVKLGRIEERNLSNVIKANGFLRLPPQNQASVSSPVGGVIKSISVTEGVYVRKGETLAFIENPDLISMQKEYLEARSNYSFSEKDYQRQRELLREGVVSEKKFQQAEASFKADRALMKSLEGQLQVLGISADNVAEGKFTSGIRITSPLNGYIKEINVNTGAFAEPQKELFEIVDNHHVHIDLQVYQDDLVNIREGQKVYFTLSSHELVDFEATIFSIGKAFDDETKSVTVHAEIKNNRSAYLLPGLYIEGRIETSSNTVPALPEGAIVSEGDIQYIFVVKETGKKDTHVDHVKHGDHQDHVEHEDHVPHKEHGEHDEQAEHKEKDEHDHKENDKNKRSEKHQDEHETKTWTFERVQVKTGVSDAGYTEVRPAKSLHPDAKVVIKGAFYLLAEMKKKEGGDEHDH